MQKVTSHLELSKRSLCHRGFAVWKIKYARINETKKGGCGKVEGEDTGMCFLEIQMV